MHQLYRYRTVVLFMGLALTCSPPLFPQDRLLPVFRFEHVTVAQGLPSDATRSNVVTDHQGFAWVGTTGGLVRYDGNACKVYRNIPEDPHSISSNVALSLLVDRRGLLWVGNLSSGLSLYDAPNDRFLNFPPPGKDSTFLGLGAILMISEDRAGNVWFSSRENMVVVADMSGLAGETNVDSIAAHVHFQAFHLEGSNEFVYLGDWDQESVLLGTARGLFTYHRPTRQMSRLKLPPASDISLDTAYIVAFQWESPERLWIATRFHGLFLFDRSRESLTAFHKRPPGGKEPRDDRIVDAVIDRGGRLWIGTKYSLDLFDVSSGTYREYLTYPIDPPPHPLLLSVDRMGRLWVTTTDAALYVLTPQSLRFPHFALKGSDGRPRSMETIDEAGDGTYWVASGGKVVRVRMADLRVLQSVDLFKGKGPVLQRAGVMDSYRDRTGAIWYGTWGLGLYRFEPRTGKVDNFRSSRQLPGLTNKVDVCSSIAGGSETSLWIAGYQDGLLQFDTRTNTFARRSTLGGANLSYVVHVLKDKDGRVWISDEVQGVFLLDPATGVVDHLTHDPNRPGSLSDNRGWCTYQAPDGKMWVGTRFLNLWNPESRSFTQIPNSSFGDLEKVALLGTDTQGRLWVFYDFVGGVGVLSPGSRSFSNFDFNDGFCESVYEMHTLPDGRVLLLGEDGMNLVRPESLSTVHSIPPLAITRMSINDSVNVPPQMRSAGTVELRHEQSVLEFEFAVIDPVPGLLVDPVIGPLVSYLYRLEGLEESWVNASGRRYVRYPGLAPGEYVFRVKATSKYNRWPDREVALAVSIAPPWWRTWWAYAGYGFLVLGLLSTGYRIRLKQLSLKQQAELEHLQAEHLSDVDRLKSRFFANISHEFRTPLTLILGPIEKIRSKVREESVQADLSMMQRNAQRLLRLINQLLDLSKLDAGAMRLHASRMNIVPLVKGIAYSFESSAGLRRMELDVVAGQEEIEVYCDRDAIEKILSNLISNAFKFTPEGGKVKVRVSQFTLSPPLSSSMKGEEKGGEFVEIAVSDTGVGIPLEQLEKVFDRFYQVDASQTREHEGSGIGLALVKELVELHHGTIGVKSEAGRGTEFTVRLPLGRRHLRDDEIVEAPAGVDAATYEVPLALAGERAGDTTVEGESLTAGDQRPIVLVVDDNADVRTYVRSFLVDSYQMLEARDGTEGIEKAQETVPDLVISDVMMPKKDGYEVCRTLKLDEKTSHIPVILLTAKAASENRIEGLETGADDYLVKPFEPKELLARVRNLIALRRKLRERFNAAQVLKPGEVTVSSIDDAFLQKVKGIVETHMSEEGFGVEDLSREVAMSRSQIHRKLMALTNLPAGEFIRYLRLHRAMDLLRQNAATVAEVAYMVGFSSPAYFTKCFHEQFAITPSEIRRTEQ